MNHYKVLLEDIHGDIAEWLNDNFADMQPWEVTDDDLEDKYWEDLDKRILPRIKTIISRIEAIGYERGLNEVAAELEGGEE